MHKEIVDFLNKTVDGCGARLVEAEIGDSTIFVSPEKIKDVCQSLKDSPEFEFNVLQVVTGCDYEDRLEISYVLASFTKNYEVIIKAALPKESKEAVPAIDSVVSVWKSANFQERECYDMVGVKFVGHPDLRRILCSDDWEGYPMRKDYKVQETYHGMTVNPEEKINSEDHFFYKKVESEAAEAKKVTHSWKG